MLFYISMDSIKAYYPNSIKYIDNNYDSSHKSNLAFPGKKIFESACFIPNNKYNNINNINKRNIEKFKSYYTNNVISFNIDTDCTGTTSNPGNNFGGKFVTLKDSEGKIAMNNNRPKYTNNYNAIIQYEKNNDYASKNITNNKNCWSMIKDGHHRCAIVDERIDSTCPPLNDKWIIVPNTTQGTYFKVNLIEYSKKCIQFSNNVFYKQPNEITYDTTSYTKINNSAFRLTEEFTIMTRFLYTKKPNEWVRLIGKGHGTDRNYGLWVDKSGKPLAQIYGISIQDIFTTDNDIVPLNTYTHLALTFKKNGSFKLFINGTLYKEISTTGTPNTDNNPLTLGGGFQPSHVENLKGKIKDSYLFDKVLTDDEIKNFYNGYNCENVSSTRINPNDLENAKKKYDELEEECDDLDKKYNLIKDNDKMNKISREHNIKSMYKFEKKIYDDNNQMNSNFEHFDNANNFEDLIKYNQELTEKQELQKDKINLIKEKELSLEKTSELLKTSTNRNNFKKKVIYTLVALIFFLFILSLSTYIYFVRDFKIQK